MVERQSRKGGEVRVKPIYKPGNKLLLCLQFWEGDKKQAMELARFIADLIPERCEIADFLFVSRFDCSHDMETIKYVSKKFSTLYYTSKRRGTGWPNGCNDLFFGSMEYVYHMTEARKIPWYKAVFTFEADGVPLAANWINQFSRAWDEETAKHLTFVLGAYLMYPGPHVNGNAMFSCDLVFLKWLVKQVGGAPPSAGWDFALYPDFRKWGARDYPALKSYWGSRTFTEEGFNAALGQSIAYLHGVKDGSLLKMARKKFLGQG